MIKPTELDRKVELAEKKVLVYQRRILTERDRASSLIYKLESEASNLADMKSEWIRKRNFEEQKAQSEAQRLQGSHRNNMEDLRVKFESERQDKLRGIRMKIAEKEREIEDWRMKRDEAVTKTKTEENNIKASYQSKINALLRAEMASQRTGVVETSRLLITPNLLSMNYSQRSRGLGLKRNVPY